MLTGQCTHPLTGAELVEIHHEAPTTTYVLEGSIVMAVNGEQPVTVTAGHMFYEGPNDVHTVGRNASKTIPAKFVVFLLKDQGAPVLTPLK